MKLETFSLCKYKYSKQKKTLGWIHLWTPVNSSDDRQFLAVTQFADMGIEGVVPGCPHCCWNVIGYPSSHGFQPDVGQRLYRQWRTWFIFYPNKSWLPHYNFIHVEVFLWSNLSTVPYFISWESKLLPSWRHLQ